jgi:membrane-bound lytic murein transglycosylase A
MKKSAKILLAVIVVMTLLTGYQLARQHRAPILLSKSGFSQLKAWEQDTQSPALAAFKQSCAEILKRPPAENFSSLPQSGKVGVWQKICIAAQSITADDNEKARKFFQTWFQPYRVSQYRNHGLFTGYYLPLLHASLKPDVKFNVPIYAPPTDLLKIQLGLFRPELAGTVLIAQQKNRQLLPYPDRAAINQGAITKTSQVILWSDNALDVFFAQIQGSALVELPDKRHMLIHYAGSNGRHYTPIGKVLIASKALTPENVSMQTIREWLNAHPEQMDLVLNQNASYVFFTLSNNTEANGAEEVKLTPGSSLAVDNKILPLGAPMWLETSITIPNQPSKAFQHLLIAQDTGGAIRGPLRGDIYWGAGDTAAQIAGHMHANGDLWILLPTNKT